MYTRIAYRFVNKTVRGRCRNISMKRDVDRGIEGAGIRKKPKKNECVAPSFSAKRFNNEITLQSNIVVRMEEKMQ